jgi:hypothetical protein
MRRWHWWGMTLALLVIVVATLVTTRYTMQCVATHPAPEMGAGPLRQGTQASDVVCYVLDRWTGEVRPGNPR